jgi:hypothetical protein
LERRTLSRQGNRPEEAACTANPLEVIMRTSKKSSRVPFAIAAFATIVSATTARAEYRCERPALPEEKRACELVKQGPDVLRRFVDRTRTIYQLYFYDYVTEADWNRWDTARRNDEARSNVAIRRDDRIATR